MPTIKYSEYSIQSPISTHMHDQSQGSFSSGRSSCICCNDMRYCCCLICALLLLGFAMSLAFSAGQRSVPMVRSVNDNFNNLKVDVDTDSDVGVDDEIQRFKRDATKFQMELKPLKEAVGWDDEEQVRHRRKTIDELLSSFQMDFGEDEDDDEDDHDDEDAYKKTKCKKGGRCGGEPTDDDWLFANDDENDDDDDDEKNAKYEKSLHKQLGDDDDSKDIDYNTDDRAYAIDDVQGSSSYSNNNLYPTYESIRKHKKLGPKVESLYFPGRDLEGGHYMQIPNDLSHEADYKLSKIEQELSEKKLNLSKYPLSWIKKRSSVVPMHEIKLKTSLRLMRKGMGPYLPSSLQAAMASSGVDIPYMPTTMSKENKVSNIGEYAKSDTVKLPITGEYSNDPRTYASKTVSDAKPNWDYYKPYNEMSDVVNKGQYGLPLWNPRYKRISEAKDYEEYQKELHAGTGDVDSSDNTLRPKRNINSEAKQETENAKEDKKDSSSNIATNDGNMKTSDNLKSDIKDDSQDLRNSETDKGALTAEGLPVGEKYTGEADVVVVGREEDATNRFNEGMNLESESEEGTQRAGRQRRCLMFENDEPMEAHESGLKHLKDVFYGSNDYLNDDDVVDTEDDTDQDIPNYNRLKKKYHQKNEHQYGPCRCMLQGKGKQNRVNDEDDYYDDADEGGDGKKIKLAYHGRQYKKHHKMMKDDEEPERGNRDYQQLKSSADTDNNNNDDNEKESATLQRRVGDFRSLFNDNDKSDTEMILVDGVKMPAKILRDFAFVHDYDADDEKEEQKQRIKSKITRIRKRRSIEKLSKEDTIIEDTVSTDIGLSEPRNQNENSMKSPTNAAQAQGTNNEANEPKHVIKRQAGNEQAFDMADDAAESFEFRHKLDEDNDDEFKSPPFASNYDKLVEKLSKYSHDQNGFQFDTSSKVSQILHSPKNLWHVIENTLKDGSETDDSSSAISSKNNLATLTANAAASKPNASKTAMTKTGGVAGNVTGNATATNNPKYLTSSDYSVNGYSDDYRQNCQQNENPSSTALTNDDKGSDFVKLKVNLNADIEGDKEHGLLGIGNMTVVAGSAEERERRDLLYNGNLRPDRRCKPKDNYDCDQTETPLEKLMSGKLSKQIVNNIFKVVRKNPRLCKLWPALKQNRPITRKTLKTFYAMRAKDSSAEMRRTEEMLKTAMKSIEDIASESTSPPPQSTCSALSPDLQLFYDMIMENYYEQDKYRRKREEAFNIANEFYNEVRTIDPNVIEEKSRIVKKLLRQYDELSPEHQDEMSSVHDELEKDLIFLHKLKESKDVLQERRKREVEEWEAAEWEAKEGDEELIKRMQAEISPEYLKLVKTAEIFKEAANDNAPFFKEK